jgi:hypothetical protein
VEKLTSYCVEWQKQLEPSSKRIRKILRNIFYKTALALLLFLFAGYTVGCKFWMASVRGGFVFRVGGIQLESISRQSLFVLWAARQRSCRPLERLLSATFAGFNFAYVLSVFLSGIVTFLILCVIQIGKVRLRWKKLTK